MSNFIAANPSTDSLTKYSNQARLGTPIYEHPGPLVPWRKAFYRALGCGSLVCKLHILITIFCNCVR